MQYADYQSNYDFARGLQNTKWNTEDSSDNYGMLVPSLFRWFPTAMTSLPIQCQLLFTRICMLAHLHIIHRGIHQILSKSLNLYQPLFALFRLI